MLLYMFRALNARLQEDTLYTYSIWYCHSVNSSWWPVGAVFTQTVHRQITTNSRREWQYHMLHVYSVYIPGGVTWDFSRGSFRQYHTPWGRLSLWKWVPCISPGVNAAGAFGWRPTTLLVPKVVMIRGLNLPGTPRASSACRGAPLLYFTTHTFHRPHHYWSSE